MERPVRTLVWPREDWLAKRQQHQTIVQPWVLPRLERRSRGQSHPIDDFMFDYYPISPNKLLTWHPGWEHKLEAQERDLEFFPEAYRFTDGFIELNPQWSTTRAEKLHENLRLLQVVSQRPARTGCFGLHEWAMVLGQDDVRHDSWKLRLSQGEIRNTIAELGLRCTHFDAFRFFTDEARPKNPVQLTRADQLQYDQPGCLHANMDLYKFAHFAAPIVGSNIVRDAFALAREIRTVDMQVAPYDFSELHVEPIRVETEDGRIDFISRQQQFSARASHIRAQLIHQMQLFFDGK